MRILHTSDWHIGRQFHNVSLLDDQRTVLDHIVSLVKSESVDVVLVAGDVYDRAIPPAKAVALLDDVLHELCGDLKVPVIMIAGNHDSADRLAFGSRQLTESGLHIVGPLADHWDPIVLSDEWGEVAFYGIPYVDPVIVNAVYGTRHGSHDAAMEFLTQSIVEHNGATRRSVVLSHCFIDGGDACDSERPLAMGGADKVSPRHFEPFCYTALGHLHGRQYKGQPHIRYSGSPMKYSFSEEPHKKVVTIIDVLANGGVEQRDIPLVVPRNMRTIEGELDAIIRGADADPGRDDYLLVRLTDTHAILDPMGKLRKAYPNVLHLERPAIASQGRRYGVDRKLLLPNAEGPKRGALSMFDDFYRQVCEEPMTTEQRSIVETLLDECLHGDEA